MHGRFCVKSLLFPRQCPDITGKLLQLLRILLQFSAVIGKLHQSTLQVGDIGGGELYIALPISIGYLGFFKSPYLFVRKPISILYIRDLYNAIRKSRQRFLHLAQILHIAVKQLSAQVIHLPVAENDTTRAIKKTCGSGKSIKALFDGIKAQVFYSMHRSHLLSVCAQATNRPPV